VAQEIGGVFYTGGYGHHGHQWVNGVFVSNINMANSMFSFLDQNNPKSKY